MNHAWRRDGTCPVAGRSRSSRARPAGNSKRTTRIVGIRFGPDGGARKAKVVISVALHVGEVAPDTAAQVCAIPSGVDPFMNCTVPVGLAAAPAPTTVAVSVTLPPDEMLVDELVTVVMVVCPTASVKADDVEVV